MKWSAMNWSVIRVHLAYGVLLVGAGLLLYVGVQGIITEKEDDAKLVRTTLVPVTFLMDYHAYRVTTDIDCRETRNRSVVTECATVTGPAYHTVVPRTCWNCAHFTNFSACDYMCRSSFCRSPGQQQSCISAMEAPAHKCKVTVDPGSGTIYDCRTRFPEVVDLCNETCHDLRCEYVDFHCDGRCTYTEFTECGYTVVGYVDAIVWFGYVANGTKYPIHMERSNSWERGDPCLETDSCISLLFLSIQNIWPIHVYYESENPSHWAYDDDVLHVIGSADHVGAILLGIVLVCGVGICVLRPCKGTGSRPQPQSQSQPQEGERLINVVDGRGEYGIEHGTEQR